MDYVDLSRNIVEIEDPNGARRDFESYLSELMGSVEYHSMGIDGKVDMIKGVQRMFDEAARVRLEIEYDTGEPDSLAERLRKRRGVKEERKYGLENLLQ
jgi:hypothetical protein